MSAVRRRAKLDGPHREIVDGLRADGYSVQSLATVGDGFFDLVVGGDGFNLLLEVKDPKAWRARSQRVEAREQKQRRVQAEWKGPKATVMSLMEARHALMRHAPNVITTSTSV